jgi:hypothetical protein
MGCNNKVKYTCGNTINYATCIEFQGVISENTLLENAECADVQEVIEDTYKMIDVIKEEIDVTTLENTCITFTEPKTPKSVIEQLYAKICDLEELIITQGELITTMQLQISNLQSETCP